MNLLFKPDSSGVGVAAAHGSVVLRMFTSKCGNGNE